MSRRLLAYILTCILAAYALFELLLALGLPFGKFAWGGSYKTLPISLRIASLVAIVIYAFMGAIVLSWAKIVTVFRNERFLRTALWVLFGYFCLGVLMNVASRSSAEKLNAPIICTMALLTYILIKSDPA